MSTTVATLAERALRRLGVAIVPLADRPALTVQVPAAVIATAALVDLAVIASDETPSVSDQALAMAKLASVQASLTAQAIVWWPDTSVPQAVAEEYTKLVANLLAPAFGKPADINIHERLEKRVRQVALVLSAPDLANDAVLSVHQDLSARGKVRWSVFDIPAEIEDVYTYLGAYQLAPLFGQRPSELDAKQAEEALARYIALPTSGEHVRADYF